MRRKALLFSTSAETETQPCRSRFMTEGARLPGVMLLAWLGLGLGLGSGLGSGLGLPGRDAARLGAVGAPMRRAGETGRREAGEKGRREGQARGAGERGRREGHARGAGAVTRGAATRV